MSTKPTQDSVKMVKQADVPRTYDPDGLRRRAACLCFKDRSEKEILLISSTHDVTKWVVPGGGIDPGEEPDTAAAREALEEAGAAGVIDRLLGVFENSEKRTRTWVYAFYVEQLHDDWTEARSLDRRRKWFQLRDARQALSDFKPLQVNYLNVMESAKVKA
ncbi:diphosphoinositol polyphosphate phosphohydrolase 1 [Aplysia californica]|uniref:Diphosphoinositol polyphosphate phosphohydrolase 1 n=1 Tax=Aplysia californica TaxID=6500 RepID=A0ABM0JZG7_APLCA|nr:diphosphoinositol polyphosphate phosphohydrolase 1 [Aplysia californica]XP_005105177.1 diphosphoinositol polyphosphate phosphohydrolase 1 [Aplysia californica]XP_035827425.1 diphosphoinositol polyphosphate phosphohydrolase 1 [Aplysia californica]